MQEFGLWLRRLPIALFAIFGGTALIICNPGYFWDDWVWRYQDPAQNIQIGKELGIWWAGYLTNAINALPSPSLALRGVALIAWLIAGAAAAYTLYRRRHLSSADAFDLFLLYSATHVALVRFLTSVALYNVYIASFWIGCALLLAHPESKKARIGSVLFFFFSFYLNSLLLLYGLLILLLLMIDMCSDGGSHERPSLFKNPRAAIVSARQLFIQYKPRLPGFIRANALLLATPIFFVFLKRVTHVASPVYGGYNSIDKKLVISSLFKSFRILDPTLRGFFEIQYRTQLVVAICALVCFLLLRLLRRAPRDTSWRATAILFGIGWLLFAVAVYPYLVVEKAPDLSSFYDSRNIMPAMVGLDLVLLAILNALGIIFRNIRFLNTVGRDLLLAYILGASITSGFYTGLALWRDWFTQTTIMNFLRDNSESLRDVRTFVFDDRTSGMRVGSRIIWNYEYTGNLITVYNTRDRFGISTDEYNNWPPNVPLLTDPILRQRYNIGDYQFNKPHAIIFLQNGVLPLTPVRTLAAVKAYLSGQNWQSQPDEYLKVGMGYEFVEVDAHVAEIYKITDALLAYRRDHGYFPAQIPPVAGGMPIYQIEGNNHAGPTATIDDIPGLFPAYLPRPADMVPHRADEPHYMYLSDGLDFKLVYASPHDLAYAKQAHPALIDPARSGYGVWTLDAKNW